MSDEEKQQPQATQTRRLTIDELGLAAALETGSALGANALLYAFFQLFKTAQIHALDNQALQRPILNFITNVDSILAQEGRVSFQMKDRAVFINSVKLKLTSEEYEIGSDTGDFLAARGIGGFTIESSLSKASVEELLRILVYAPAEQRKFEAIQLALSRADLSFRINRSLGTGGRSSSDAVLERRGYTFLSYSKLVVLYRMLLAEEKLTTSRRQFLIRKIVRAIQSLVDICLEDDHTFLGVSSVKSGDAYPAHHAANTAVLSIALGEKLGLKKVELGDLGVAAVFHDIGMKGIAPEITDKPTGLDHHERNQVDQHILRGVEFLLEERTFTRADLARIVVAFEHHRRADGGGLAGTSRLPDLFSRIVNIAAAYDALTTDRPWRKAMLPDEALGQMLKESGGQYDAALLKIFINSLGMYPVGTLVRLGGGERGVVVYGGVRETACIDPSWPCSTNMDNPAERSILPRKVRTASICARFSFQKIRRSMVSRLRDSSPRVLVSGKWRNEKTDLPRWSASRRLRLLRQSSPRQERPDLNNSGVGFFYTLPLLLPPRRTFKSSRPKDSTFCWRTRPKHFRFFSTIHHPE